MLDWKSILMEMKIEFDTRLQKIVDRLQCWSCWMRE